MSSTSGSELEFFFFSFPFFFFNGWCYIRCILRCAITVVLILGAVVLVLIVLVLVVFTLILYKRCVDLLFGALLLTDYQI